MERRGTWWGEGEEEEEKEEEEEDVCKNDGYDEAKDDESGEIGRGQFSCRSNKCPRFGSDTATPGRVNDSPSKGR